MHLILLGPPGAGKGTQAKRLAERVGAAHVASGDLFRDNLGRGTPLGFQAKEYMERGALVPDEVTVSMVLERCAAPDAQGGVVLDGFPRNQAQAEALDRAFTAAGSAVDRAVVIECGHEVVKARLAGRALAEGRADDTPEVIEERLRTYERQTAPLAAYYEAQGKLRRVDGDQAIDAVTEDLVRAVGQE